MALPENYIPELPDGGKKVQIEPSTLLHPIEPSFFDYRLFDGVKLKENGIKLNKRTGNTYIDGSFAGSDKANIGTNTVIGLTKDTGLSLRSNLVQDGSELRTELSASISHDLIRFIDDRSTSAERRKILLGMGIDIPLEELHDRGNVRSLAVGFTIANMHILETTDPTHIGTLTASLGISIEGGKVVLQDKNLIEQWGLASSFGPSYNILDNSLGLSLGEQSLRHLSEKDSGMRIEQTAVIKVTDMIARMTIKAPIIQTENTRYDLRGSGNILAHAGVISAGLSTGLGRTDANGKGVFLELGWGTNGPVIMIGRENALAGAQNLIRTFTLGARITEVHYTPGFNVVDASGNIYGKMGDVFQFFHRTPEMESLFQKSVTILSELQSKKQIILTKDFVETLDTPKKLGQFVDFLSKNKEYILSPRCTFEGIHFTDNIASPKKQGERVVFDHTRSQIHVQSLDTNTLLENETGEEKSPSLGKKVEMDLTLKYNIHVRSSREVTENMRQGIDVLIAYLAKYNGLDKIQGKNINIIPDMEDISRESFIHHFIASSGTFQEITIPEGVLSAMLIGKQAIIPFSLTDEDISSHEQFSEYFGFDRELLPVLHIVPDRDSLLLDGNHGEGGGYRRYDGENGKLILSRSYFEEVQKITRKPKETLSLWDSMTLRSFRSILRNSQIKNLDYIRGHVQNSFQSQSESLKTLAMEIGGNTLYSLRPIPEVMADGYRKCEVYKDVSHTLAGSVFYKKEGKVTHIRLDTGEEFHISHISDPDAIILRQRFPWLNTYVITGIQGIDTRSGKEAYIQPQIVATNS